MRKSKRIIILIICVIFLVIGSYGYMVYSSKNVIGGSFLHLNGEIESGTLKIIDCKESSCLVIIKPQFIACNANDLDLVWHNDDNNSIDDNRDLPGFVENKEGKLDLEIYESYDLVDTISMNIGEKLTKILLLKKGKRYTIKFKCKYEGLFINHMVQYKL